MNSQYLLVAHILHFQQNFLLFHITITMDDCAVKIPLKQAICTKHPFFTFCKRDLTILELIKLNFHHPKSQKKFVLVASMKAL